MDRPVKIDSAIMHSKSRSTPEAAASFCVTRLATVDVTPILELSMALTLFASEKQSSV